MNLDHRRMRTLKVLLLLDWMEMEMYSLFGRGFACGRCGDGGYVQPWLKDESVVKTEKRI
jgi:hypothetical protein